MRGHFLRSQFQRWRSARLRGETDTSESLPGRLSRGSAQNACGRLLSGLREANSFRNRLRTQRTTEGGNMPRHKLTREEQIRGLKKALANPKTPKAFRAGMEARLAKLQRGS